MFRELFTESSTKDVEAGEKFLKELDKVGIKYKKITKNIIDPDDDPMYYLVIPRNGLVKLTNQLCNDGYYLDGTYGTEKDECIQHMKRDKEWAWFDDNNHYSIGKKVLIIFYGHATGPLKQFVEKVKC